MRRQQRRQVYYDAISLLDGTVMAAIPVRKPTRKTMKRDSLKIDAEDVCRESLRAGKELSDVRSENRLRFLDIIATALNTRRALREIVLPELTSIREEIAALRSHLDRIEQTLETRPKT